MATSPDALTRHDRLGRTPRRGLVVTIAGLVAGAVLIAGASVFLVDPDRIDLTIENPTGYRVHVEVRPTDGGSRLGLGTVSPDGSKTFPEVIDQGESWLFVYTYAGVTSPPVELSRESITDDTVVIPDSFAEQLRDAGLDPSAPS